MGRVLLIDAEEDFAQQLIWALERWGYEVIWTRDGKDGQDRALADRPAAIVLCFELPRMSGQSLCTKLKKDEALKDIPVIVTSRQATVESFEQHKKLGTHADGYLKKPFRPKALFDLLQPFLPAPKPPSAEEEQEVEGPTELEAAVAAMVEVKPDPTAALEQFQTPTDDEDVFGRATQMAPVDPALLKQIREDDVQSRATQVAQIPPELLMQIREDDKHSRATQVMQIPTTVLQQFRQQAEDQKALNLDPPALEKALETAWLKIKKSHEEAAQARADLRALRVQSRDEVRELKKSAAALAGEVDIAHKDHAQRMALVEREAVSEASALHDQLRGAEAQAAEQLQALRAEIRERLGELQRSLSERATELASVRSRVAALEAEVSGLRASRALAEAGDGAMASALAELQRDAS